MKHLPATLSVAQRRTVMACLERQGYYTPSYSSACHDAVWAMLAEREAYAGCHTDSECIVLPTAEVDGPCWSTTNKHWIEVHPQTGSMARIKDACGDVDALCYPDPPPLAYCDAGQCRFRDYPPAMAVPRDFTCPEAGLPSR